MVDHNQLQQQRIRRGECPGCGVEVFKFVGLLRKRKVPLTIPHHVENGQCLSCCEPSGNNNNGDSGNGGYQLQQEQDALDAEQSVWTHGASIPRYLSVKDRVVVNDEGDDNNETDAMSAVSGLTSTMGTSVIAMQNAAANTTRANTIATAHEPPGHNGTADRPGACAAFPAGLELQQEQQAAVHQQHVQLEELRRHQLMLQKIEEAEGESAFLSMSQQQQESQASQVGESERQKLQLLKKIQDGEQEINNAKSAYKTGGTAASQPGAFPAPPTSSQLDQPPGDLTREEWLMIQKVEEAERALQNPAALTSWPGADKSPAGAGASQPGSFPTPPAPTQDALLIQKVEEAENAGQRALPATVSGGQQQQASTLNNAQEPNLRDRVGETTTFTATGREHLPGAYAQPGIVASGPQTSQVSMFMDEESWQGEEQIQADTVPLPPNDQPPEQAQQQEGVANPKAANQARWFRKRSVQRGIVMALLALIVVLVVVIVVVTIVAVVGSNSNGDALSSNSTSEQENMTAPVAAPTQAPISQAPTSPLSFHNGDELALYAVQWGYAQSDFDDELVTNGNVTCSRDVLHQEIRMSCVNSDMHAAVLIEVLDADGAKVWCQRESRNRMKCTAAGGQAATTESGSSLASFSSLLTVVCVYPPSQRHTNLDLRVDPPETVMCGQRQGSTTAALPHQTFAAEATVSLSAGRVCFGEESGALTLLRAPAGTCVDGAVVELPINTNDTTTTGTVSVCTQMDSCSTEMGMQCSLDVPGARFDWFHGFGGRLKQCKLLSKSSSGEFMWNQAEVDGLLERELVIADFAAQVHLYLANTTHAPTL